MHCWWCAIYVYTEIHIIIVCKKHFTFIIFNELCTSSYDEYIELAVKLATNKEYYNSIVRKLKENREKVLFNNEEYVNHFVSLMHNIWKRNYNENIEYIWVFYTNYDSPGNDIMTTDKRDNDLHKIKNTLIVLHIQQMDT